MIIRLQENQRGVEEDLRKVYTCDLSDVSKESYFVYWLHLLTGSRAEAFNRASA